MSKHYWDEYLNLLLDHNEVDRILKFHQSNIPYKNPIEIIDLDINKTDWLITNSKSVPYTDTCLRRYEWKDIPQEIKRILESLKENIFTNEIVLTLPIITLLEPFSSVEGGIYSFNFNKMELLKYQELPQKKVFNLLKESEAEYIISYFLNIEKAIYLWEGLGYIEGVLQIGAISGGVSNNLRLIQSNLFISPQEFTNNLGLNVRKQLLIKNDIARF